MEAARVEAVTEEADCTAHMEAFDREAGEPRPGWVQEAQGAELWTKDAAGLRGYVMGLPASDELGAGYWQFRVVDMENELIVGKGHSSRRGWAMDGADTCFPSLN